MKLFNIVLYIILAVMLVRTFLLSKRNKKTQELMLLVRELDDEQSFFDKIDEYINSIDDAEFAEKAKVIRLWGVCFHGRYERFEKALESLQLDPIVTSKNGRSITPNEDSFFYLSLAIPQQLYVDGKNEELEMLKEKLSSISDLLDGQLVTAISEQLEPFYTRTGDKGKTFFEKVMDGDYGEYAYSKNLIGLYKDIIAVMLAKIYEEEGNTEKYEEVLPIVQSFMDSRVGNKWVKGAGLNIELPKDEEEDSEDESDSSNTEEKEEDTEE